MFNGLPCGCYIRTISIEKQRKCAPFVFSLFHSSRMGGLGAARLPIRFPPQLLFCSGRRGIFLPSLFFKIICRFRQIYYRILYFRCFTCFRLVLKSKGNARLFSNFVWLRKWSHLKKYVCRTAMRMLHTYD